MPQKCNLKALFIKLKKNKISHQKGEEKRGSVKVGIEDNYEVSQRSVYSRERKGKATCLDTEEVERKSLLLLS